MTAPRIFRPDGFQQMDRDFDFPSGPGELSKSWKSGLTKFNMWIGQVQG